MAPGAVPAVSTERLSEGLRRVRGSDMLRTAPPVRPNVMPHDAFISYSHSADGRLAPALQRGLEQLAKPWYRLRALRVFRDETNLSASPQLWQSIVDELAQARWFLLFASAEAARSKWVAREVEWWLANRGPTKLLILLSSGELAWDEAACDFDWSRSTALPSALSGAFAAEPHFIDLRDLKDGTALTLKHTGFRAAVLKIAAPLHGRSPDEMDGDAVRAHARNRRWAGAAASGLVALTAAALWQWQAAVRARDTALSRQFAAQSTAMLERSVDTALLLAVQGWQTAPTPEARSAMLRGLQLAPIARFLPGPGGPVVGVAIDAAARSVIAAGAGGVVQRVPSDGAAPDWSYTSDQPITAMATARDGRLVAIGRRDGRVLLLEPGRPAPLQVLDGRHKEQITALAFSAEGKRLVSGSRYRGIAMWDVDAGTALGGIEEIFNSHSIDALAVADDGRRVLAAMGLRIAVWDSADWSRVGDAGPKKADDVMVHAIAATPGAAQLSVAGWENSRWRLWRWPMEVGSDTVPTVVPTRAEGIGPIALNVDGRVLAFGTGNGQVGFLVAGIESSFKVHKDEVRAVALSADGRWSVSGGADGRVVLWDRDALPPHSGRLGPETRGIAGLAVSPDGRWIVSGNAKGELLWISADGDRPVLRVGPAVQPLGEARSKARGVMAVEFAPDGRGLAVALADGTTVLQPVDGGTPQRARDWLAGYPVLALAFTRDGRMLATAHADGSVVLRDGETGAPRSGAANIVNDSSEGIQALAFSDDGRRLIVQTGFHGVVVRDVDAISRASRATTEQALALTARAASAVMATSVARAPSSLTLWAWGDTLGQVELRRADDGPAKGPPLVVEGGHALQNLVLSSDGKALAMSGAEPGILLWDLRQRRPVDEPLRAAKASRGIAFSRDGRFLVARYSDGELEWWSTDGDRWARLLCGIVNRRFTDREWATYVGGRRRGDGACEAPPS